MEKLTRQEAKKLGVSKCFGSVCEQHPELEGFRWVSGSCVACAKNALNANRNKNRERTSAQRQKDYKKLLQSEVNVEKKKLRGKVYYEKTKALLYAKKQSWLLNNPGKCGLYASRHRQNHPEAKNADTAKRRSDKLKRTPVWLSKDELWLIREALIASVAPTSTVLGSYAVFNFVGGLTLGASNSIYVGQSTYTAAQDKIHWSAEGGIF